MRARVSLSIVVAVMGSTIALAPLGAQDRLSADFTTARRQFVEHQSRSAASTVVAASAYVRQELGRSRDADVGERLMAAEDRLDKIASRLRASAIESESTLDSAFAQTDRLLAEHHWKMAAWELSMPRLAPVASVAEDLGASANFLARSFTFAGRAPSTETTAAIADAKRVAEQISLTNALPKDARQVIDALGKQIVPPGVVANR